MELRLDTNHKENVPPRPATPLRPEQRRLLKSLGVSLGSGQGRWVPMGQAERGGPATTPSPGTMLHQEPCQIQTNLASPRPRLGLALKDTTGRLMNSSFRQQSNLWPLGVLPQGRARECAVQQSNLSIRETSSAECGSCTSPHLWSEPHESFWPHMMPRRSPLPRGPLALPSCSLRQSRLLATDTPCWDFRPAAGYAPLNGHTRPGPRSWCGLGSWTSRLMGDPLTLQDLAVPAQRQTQAPSQAAISQLLASVQRLECEAAHLRRWASQKPPGPSQEEPWTSDGQALPAHPQPSQPVLASWDERKQHPQGLRENADFPATPGVQADLSDCVASSKPTSLETTLEMPTGDFLDPEQAVLSAHPLRRRENCSPGPTYSRGKWGYPLLPQGVGNREARLCSSAFSRAAQGVLPGGEGGEKAPWGQVGKEEERTASCPPDTAPARGALQNKARNIVSLESEMASRQLLSRCFRAWWQLVWRQWAVAAAVALGRRQLLRRGLQALRWTMWLREAQLEVAWGRYMQALRTRSFHKWRNLTQQQKQRQPHIQAGPGPAPCGGDQGQDSPGRKPVVDPAQRSSFTLSAESLREEARAQPIPSSSGSRTNGGDGRVQILQALQQLAVFLLWCHQKEWARQERGVQGEASRAILRTRRMGRPPQAWCSPAADAAWVAPLDPQYQRAWLCRCFGAWQQLVKRGTQYRHHLADRQVGTMRICLQQWVWMKQLQALDGAKVTQLTLCRQKAGNMALCSSAPGGATAHGLGAVAQAQGLLQEQGRGSLQKACRRLALHRVLLLWRERLSQHQRADSFFQGTQRQMLGGILRAWHLRVWGPGNPSGNARTTSAPELLGSVPGEEASLGCSIPRSSLGKASRAPALLETLQLSFLWAAGRRQQGRCLLLWQARAQQSRSAAKWHQLTLQRRILLGWSHWATAQGSLGELAARWAWDRSCRAMLGLWRRRLEQWQELEQWTRGRGQRLVRDALRHWHSCWQRQQFLRGQYQRWMQVHLQGLRRAVFWGWQQAAARRRHTVTRVLEVWAQPAAQGHVQRVTITQFQQAGPRHLLQTHWAQWRTTLLRVWLESRAEAQKASTTHPRPRAHLRHRPRLASRGRLLVIMDAAAPWKQARSCRLQATGPVLHGPTQRCSLGGRRKWKETSWAQSDRAPPLCLQWPGCASWAQGQLPTGPGGDCSSETSTIKGKGQVDKRWLGRKYLQRWRLEALLCRLQGSRQARRLAATWQCWVDAQGAEELARTLLRQWHLRWAWRTWRQRVVRLRVARRLQQQDGRVLPQAFEKWHLNLAARGRRRGATSSLRPPEQGGHKEPWEQAGSYASPCVWTQGGTAGPAAAVTCSHGKKTGTEPAFPGKKLCPTIQGVQAVRPQGAHPQPCDGGSSAGSAEKQ